MSFAKAFGFFFLIFSLILFYMTYTWYLEYKSALKSRKVIFEIEYCQSLSGKKRRILAFGKIVGENSKKAVDITEFQEYLNKNSSSNTVNTLEICKKGMLISVWDYDTGMLRGRDENRNLESDNLRASVLYQKIKFWIFLSVFIFILGAVLTKNSE